MKRFLWTSVFLVEAGSAGAACFTTAPAGGGSIAAAIVPSRTSGVAPLAVFFDSLGTADPATTSRPFGGPVDALSPARPQGLRIR